MKLNAVETGLLGMILLGWAGLPLAIHLSGSVVWMDRVGPVMMVGLCVAALAAFGVLWRAARRLATASDRRLAEVGFETFLVEESEVADWIPPQFDGPTCRIDDFAVADGPASARPVHRRPTAVGCVHVYPITVHARGGASSRHRMEGYTVTCLDAPGRDWPEFTLVGRTWMARLEGWLGGDRVNLDPVGGIRPQWIVRGPDAAAVRRVLTPDVWAVLQLPKGWRLAARGRRLFVYAPGAHLLPESCLPWVAASESTALRFVEAAGS